MNSIVDKINNSSWADWSLDKFEIDYERVLITVSEDIEGNLTICCKDYIGFSFIGHWDESVIEEINVETYGSLIDESLQVVKSLYGESPLPGGGVKKIDDSWYQVNIKLIDGNIIKIACKSLEVVEH
ncbi:hypothetical protein [Desulfosporosinus nitroreducens]|uniref:hypothetical protein n=1 Tax=Desulfosporosinus nitroreducens TaxID=2018668 RepID=UPI00207CA920|nr:hypothetical protein [Desulfosporosinus nitroreducens]MCO1604716.1 hypothetical protein [Desulfosporosinus nitroreducens]